MFSVAMAQVQCCAYQYLSLELVVLSIHASFSFKDFLLTCLHSFLLIYNKLHVYYHFTLPT